MTEANGVLGDILHIIFTYVLQVRV